ncbi:hypothetical protein Agub_g13493 [Astrephomene gubernaculifera]|uniref:Uncharacterized protein n=1 Tax=Astrephomene gubernaculifera TaxID=47775 RepID=A0AAD3HS49_9CHLO|nr:hypothetical protein Agub_g13493 [Astrephomene gubernaculifera]
MYGSRGLSVAMWLRKRARGHFGRQRYRWLQPRNILLCIGLLACYWPYQFLREHVREAHADSLLRAAQSAALRLKSLQQDSLVRQCVDAAWTGRMLVGESFEGPCSRVNDLLALLRAAGPIIPLHSDGREYNRTGICGGGCFFAGNVRDAQLVMPNYIYHLIHVVSALGEQGNPTFVSIYESGSHDRTTGWLRVLGDVLDAISVPHELQLGGSIQRQKGEERIHFLARVRSAALTPLYQQCSIRSIFCAPADDPHSHSQHHSHLARPGRHLAAGGAGRVVFLNDVLFAASDVLRLLQYPADLVCGLDLGMAAEPDLTQVEHQDTVTAYLQHLWMLPAGLARRLARMQALERWWRRQHKAHEARFRSFGPLFFYDKCVARDISGRMFTNRAPYVAYEPSIRRVAMGQPVRVHCCWNGLAVIGAEPLVRRAVQFREHVEGECSASECSLLCDDMWRLGYDDVIMDPNVRVTYDVPGASRLYRGFTADVPLGVPGVAYMPDVAEVLSLPKHEDLLREAGGADSGQPRTRQVDCCDLAKGADMVEFRDPGVCHNATVVLS